MKVVVILFVLRIVFVQSVTYQYIENCSLVNSNLVFIRGKNTKNSTDCMGNFLAEKKLENKFITANFLNCEQPQIGIG